MSKSKWSDRKPQPYLTQELKSSMGSDESSRVYAITCVANGKTEVVIEKTITKRAPIEELEEVLDQYEQMNGGGGRRVITIDEMVDVSLHRKAITDYSKERERISDIVAEECEGDTQLANRLYSRINCTK